VSLGFAFWLFCTGSYFLIILALVIMFWFLCFGYFALAIVR
jgi:hypothetical protein